MKIEGEKGKKVDRSEKIVYNVGNQGVRGDGGMIYPARPVVLKNGKSILFREVREEDAAEMLACLGRMCAETDYLSQTAAEAGRMTPEEERAYLRNCIASPDRVMIVAEADGAIAGNCQVQFLNRERTRHRAVFMIGLLSDYWGQGIGSAMFGEMERLARARGGIRQLELEVAEDNLRAQGLYRKMGFSEVARLPDALRRQDGTYRAIVYMRKVLE